MRETKQVTKYGEKSQESKMRRIPSYSAVHLIAEIRLISVNAEIPRILAILDILAIPAFYEMMACAYATPVLPLQD